MQSLVETVIRSLSVASLTWDDLAATQSALVGEALLIEGRVRSARLERAEARAALKAAHVALSDGAGPRHALTLEAASLLAALDDQDRVDPDSAASAL